MRTILVVDDDADMRELAYDMLKDRGHQVTMAGSGEEVLKRLTEDDYAVVLTDLRMKGMQGLELLNQIKRDRPDINVILMTAFGSVETAVEAMKHGASDYLTKPVKLDELEMLLDKAYDKNRLRLENINLRMEVSKVENHRIVGKSQGIQKVLETVRRWGVTDEHVLIHGESGTGKELVARAVMLAGLGGDDRVRRMKPVRRRHPDGFDVRIRAHLLHAVVGPGAVALAERFQHARIDVRGGGQLELRHLFHGRQNFRSADADSGDAQLELSWE